MPAKKGKKSKAGSSKKIDKVKKEGEEEEKEVSWYSLLLLVGRAKNLASVRMDQSESKKSRAYLLQLVLTDPPIPDMEFDFIQDKIRVSNRIRDVINRIAEFHGR